MIIVRRLTGQPFAINPDLIERIEATPDTILVLLDGTRYIVDQSMDEVVTLIEEHRAAVVARSLRRPVVVEQPSPPRGDGDVVPLPTRSRGES